MSRRRTHLIVAALACAVVIPGTIPVSAQNPDIEVAGVLFVDLQASDLELDVSVWPNQADPAEGVGDFMLATPDSPIFETIDGAPAVSFTGTEAYSQPLEDFVPEGLAGPDATRTIEVWAYNPDIADEETLVAWGTRGGPDGTNMSFNYGRHGNFGAVGHWGGGGPDLGWIDNDFTFGAPVAGKWHHLVYTYDGETTRVYADGRLANEEFLGLGIINTNANSRITIASQLEADGVTLTTGLRGSLSIGQIRIHDDVLTDEQILNNFEVERDAYASACEDLDFIDAPADPTLSNQITTYVADLTVAGFPDPELEVIQPAGTTVRGKFGSFTIRWDVPDPPPDSFIVTVRASHVCDGTERTAEASWVVTLLDCPSSPDDFSFEVADCLIVDLDAREDSAGTDLWQNGAAPGDGGLVGHFDLIGTVRKETILDVEAVTLNAEGLGVYRSQQNAPAGLVGLDPTRSIEVWAFNPEVTDEETMVAWGHRGGPEGSNMGFNYGDHPNFGAVTHWGGGGPDMGWVDNTLTEAGRGAPGAGEWHHLVYTYDGETTRAYANGELQNEEFLGAGVVNTHDFHPIAIGAQYNNANIDDFNLALSFRGSVARVRVHDGVLTPAQIVANYDSEKSIYQKDVPPAFLDVPEDQTIIPGQATYTANLRIDGFPLPTVAITSPAGATVIQDGRSITVTYAIPNRDNPVEFTVTLTASNGVPPDAQVSWTVEVEALQGEIQTAGELFVDLRATDLEAILDEGDLVDEWENQGTLNEFIVPIDLGMTPPTFETVNDHVAVTFNSFAQTDTLECVDPTPAGLVGLNPTRTIEVWAFNPEIFDEETLVSWGRRGGPDGTNMAFNYGNHPNFGAIGHWGGGGPDIGWIDNSLTESGRGAPAAGVWHHLVYTYDGRTTRVYADGELANSEQLGPGVINTYAEQPIRLAQQTNADGSIGPPNLAGTLSMGAVRIHDGVLSPAQILQNFLIEGPEYIEPSPPEFVDAPVVDFLPFPETTYTAQLTVIGFPPPVVEVLEPVGGTFLRGRFTFRLPAGEPRADFDVQLRATNSEGEAEALWTVEVETEFPCPPNGGDTRCIGLTVTDPGGNDVTGPAPHAPGDYRVVANAEDTVPPATIFYIFTAENTVTGDTISVGPLEGVSEAVLTLPAGTWTVTVEVTDRLNCPNAFDSCTVDAFTVQAVGGLFRRGDTTQDGVLNITDAVKIFGILFLGDPDISCQEAKDVNDDGAVNITDGIRILGFLFLGQPAPAAPGHENCGPDPANSAGDLGCESHPPCEG